MTNPTPTPTLLKTLAILLAIPSLAHAVTELPAAQPNNTPTFPEPTNFEDFVNKRLDETKIPRLDFRELPMLEAFAQLNQAISKNNSDEGGVLFTFELTTLLDLDGKTNTTNKVTLSLTNITARQALDYLTTLLNFRYDIRGITIQISPETSHPRQFDNPTPEPRN